MHKPNQNKLFFEQLVVLKLKLELFLVLIQITHYEYRFSTISSSL